MGPIGKIYRVSTSSIGKGMDYLEREGFKRALVEAGFKCCTSSAHTKLEIHILEHKGIFCENRTKAGELDGNNIFVYGSSKLEEFLEHYDD